MLYCSNVILLLLLLLPLPLLLLLLLPLLLLVMLMLLVLSYFYCYFHCYLYYYFFCYLYFYLTVTSTVASTVTSTGNSNVTVEQIDRVIPVAGQEDIVHFSHLFTETTKRDLTDDHLWFSVSSLLSVCIEFHLLISCFTSYKVIK